MAYGATAHTTENVWRDLLAQSAAAGYQPQQLDALYTLASMVANIISQGIPAQGGITVGATGVATAVTQIRVYSQTITPASVGAGAQAEQTFTVTGLATTDKIVCNPFPNAVANVVLTGYRVSATNTLAVTYNNSTGGGLTPTAGTWNIIAFRS